MPRNEVTIVTGGGRGIGRVVALRMAKDTNVIVVGRTEADLVSVCREIESFGGHADYVVGNVTDPATAMSAVDLAEKSAWTVRHLVCNAGFGKSGPLETFDEKVWKEIMDVNVNGAFYLVKACLPAMLGSGRGTVCLMSSIAGLKGYANVAAYCASKHALVGLARSMAKEFGKKGIVTVAICPGYVEGEMTDRSIRGVMERRGISLEEARQRVTGINPQNRIIPPEEVAETIAFVCSGKAPALSGDTLTLSGGE